MVRPRGAASLHETVPSPSRSESVPSENGSAGCQNEPLKTVPASRNTREIAEAKLTALSGAQEQWRPVPGYERYEVSDLGRLRRSGALVDPYVSRRGYLKISVYGPQGALDTSIHRLVLLAFVGPAPAGTEGAHLNGNPSDCRLSNLQWVTHAENMSHKRLHGTELLGERNVRASLTASVVMELRRLIHEGMTFAEAARRHDLNERVVWFAVRGWTWSHLPRPGCDDCGPDLACEPHQNERRRKRDKTKRRKGVFGRPYPSTSTNEVTP